ncbi:MAG: leucine--tRNA ligase [Minisyncoccia bacterium]
MKKKKYDFNKIEKHWQKEWEKSGIYNAKDGSKKKKWYSLIEFPYPSGVGLHTGHIRSNTAMDIISRKRRMEGYNVLYPIGWDAFGLPTENYAIATGISPQAATKKNTDTFRRQLKSLGFSFDWKREINTTDPEYYKWTQWMFLKFFEKKLAYKAAQPINWCPKDKIGLANEEAVGGICDRCGGPVEKRYKEQWMIKITAYAEKLLEGLKNVDFLDKIKTQQTNWIGRSEGAEIEFKVKSHPFSIKVFTTRPDTLFGATYMVLAPEHQLIEELKSHITNIKEVRDYAVAANKKSEMERTTEEKEKTGVELKGIKAINPANSEEIPVFIADYVLASYGTGAIMAVPAHDERDSAFADKFNLPKRQVIAEGPSHKIIGKEFIYTGEIGFLVNSGKRFDMMDVEKAKWEITKLVGGEKKIQYKLRDWVFSRQRYWGEPIPIIHCPDCGYVAVPEKDLPVKLPPVKNYKPRDDGQSPLASVSAWVNVKCPNCKGPAKRETDTMPNWAGSSWYFLRYIDPKNKKIFADFNKLKYWMPVDWYNGGMEHTTLHLLYSRFWNRFLYDLKLVPCAEPYQKRTAHGMILAGGGVKMSKSKGNVVDPDPLIKNFGADALRLYEVFMGPFDQMIAWDERGILGTKRFLDRVWEIAQTKVIKKPADKKMEQLIHKTVKKVSEDVEKMAFNTAVSALMIFTNSCAVAPEVPAKVWGKFILLLAPFAPHIAEELWFMLGNKKSVQLEKWPDFDAQLAIEEDFDLVVQVNGKLRAMFKMPRGSSQKEVEVAALKDARIIAFLAGQKPRKIIFVPDRLINFVI